jgi:quinolinate synthase
MMAKFSEGHLKVETARLYGKLELAGFDEKQCAMIAPLTLEINELKERQNAVILAHSYQTPDIIYGVADFTGDSYQLSRKAQETDAKKIIFSGVRFMAETAKILNPEKTVLMPSLDAGCSLAESITADDVRKLKKRHPGVPVVTYVNTSAEVKAESDVCCTSANALKIIEAMKSDEIIFLPDELMLKNMQALTKKKLIGWHGRCVVHEDFKAGKIKAFREKFPGLKVLAHTECEPSVIEASDFAGGTEGMIRYAEKTRAPAFMMITECGLADRMRVELPGKKFIGMCGICPYMKKNNLPLILKTLKNPDPEQEIVIDEDVRKKAEKALLEMFRLSR